LNPAIEKTAFQVVNIHPRNGIRRVVRALSEFAAKVESLLNRILLEKAGNEDGIEIRSNLNDRAIHKSTYPAIPVIEPETVFGGGVGMQLDHRPVTTYERMFHTQFRTFR
jgi:hypothetical protein